MFIPIPAFDIDADWHFMIMVSGRRATVASWSIVRALGNVAVGTVVDISFGRLHDAANTLSFGNYEAISRHLSLWIGHSRILHGSFLFLRFLGFELP